MTSENKIVTRDALKEILDKQHAASKVTGFTSGAFDILHSGHVDYLEKARQQCDLLVVGVNTDRSIKEYKSEKRPVVSEKARARLLAGLACVDYVFLFDEKNNNTNIELLKPKIYFKAADYNMAKLSSASIVESYGGQVKLIEFTDGFSTTSIIEDILLRFGPVIADPTPVAQKEKAPAVFLDRDGTINEHIDYLHEPEKFKPIAGAMKAMKELQDAGYKIVIVTNQPGIGLGYFTKEDLFLVNKAMMRAATKEGVGIDKIYFCPHSKSENCSCRKPAIGMIQRAVQDLNLDLENSYVIGDMTTDIQLAKNAGCHSILVETGAGGKDAICDVSPDFKVKDLAAAAKTILSKK